jgi:hypothetical protein
MDVDVLMRDVCMSARNWEYGQREKRNDKLTAGKHTSVALSLSLAHVNTDTDWTFRRSTLATLARLVVER